MRHVVVLYFFWRAEDEQAVMDFAGELSGSLGAYAIPVEHLEGGTRTYATFVRPEVFQETLPQGDAAVAWARAELDGFDIIKAEARALKLPAGQSRPRSRVEWDVMSPMATAEALLEVPRVVDCKALIVDVRRDPREE